MSRTHALNDPLSREAKARKIEAMVQLFGSVSYARVLEVGTGSGYIASYFGRQAGVKVTAVDVVDERQVTDHHEFVRVASTTLPFDEDAFDLAITNHVIEHVGNREAQLEHLRELYRCLEPGGCLYLAVPNRWRLIEAHYKLPLLSWFPSKVADAYLRVTRKVSHYDCAPLSYSQVRQLLNCVGFESRDVTLEAVGVMKSIEGQGALGLLLSLPGWCWWFAKPIMPTIIFICRKPQR